jgi:uncharacterized repeat protein (TIGR04052 family)
MMKQVQWAGCALAVIGVLGCDGESSRRGADAFARDAAATSADASAPDASAEADAHAADSGHVLSPAPASAEPPDAAPTEEPGRKLAIRFRAVVGDEPFDCARRYDVPGLGLIEPRDFKFYLQDVALIDDAGREVLVKLADRPPGQVPEVALLDFESGADFCDAGSTWMNKEIYGVVPEGKYRGIVFSNGVPEALNHADPATLPAPLQDFSMYWSWFQGFKFLVADAIGVADAAAGDEDAGVGLGGSSAVLHVGSVGCEVIGDDKFQCSVPNRNRIRLPDFDPDKHTIVTDFAALFAGAQAPTETFCHGGRASCARVYENLGLRLSSGKPTDTQKVYRIE